MRNYTIQYHNIFYIFTCHACIMHQACIMHAWSEGECEASRIHCTAYLYMISCLKAQNLWPKPCCLLGLFASQLLHCSEARNKHCRLAGFRAPRKQDEICSHYRCWIYTDLHLPFTERHRRRKGAICQVDKYKFMDFIFFDHHLIISLHRLLKEFTRAVGE